MQADRYALKASRSLLLNMTLPALVLKALEFFEWGLSQTHVMIMVESLYFNSKCGQW